MCNKNVEVEGMKRVYITSKLRHENKLCRVRDGVSHDIRANDYYEKVSPHITIVPPFYIEEGEKDLVYDILERVDIEKTHVGINNLKVWPNITDLDYIMLDVDTDIRDQQITLVDSFREAGGEYMKSPVDPHITLLKTNRMWDDPPEWLKRSVQGVIGTCTDLGSTEITEVKPVFGD